MKIAIIGSKEFDSLEYHIHDSLKFLGHKVVHIDISDVIKIPYKYNYWATKLFTKYDEFVFNKIAKTAPVCANDAPNIGANTGSNPNTDKLFIIIGTNPQCKPNITNTCQNPPINVPATNGLKL